MWLLPYAFITFILSLVSSGVGGRALWCDELLRIFAQRMTVSQLLAFENIRLFETQTPVGYLFMRPAQLLFGMETGAFLCIAVYGSIILVSVLLILEYILKERPHPIVSMVLATNPFLVYQSSELGLYTMWATVGALLLLILVSRWEAPRIRDFIVTGCLATFFVSVQFEGMFIWFGISAAVFLGTWWLRGFKPSLQWVPSLLLPALINLPMYIVAKDVPQHLTDSKTTDWSRLGDMVLRIIEYTRGLLPSLTGGSWLGVLFLIMGAVIIFQKRREMRHVVIVCTVMIFSIVFYVGFLALRNYYFLAGRYWIYAVAPALVLVGVGLNELLKRTHHQKLLYPLGMGVTGMMLVLNLIGSGAVVSQAGRQAPYKKLQAYIQAQAKERTVICINYYENRFLGGYYPIPNNGTRLSPAAYEEGVEARIRGTQKILQLVPDAMVYISGEEAQQERQRAGSTGDQGFVYQPPKLIGWAHQLCLFPEPASKPYPHALCHETRATLSAKADTNGVPITLPVSGFNAVSFRNPQGELFFGLMSPSQIQIDIYVPQKVQFLPSELQIVNVSYRSSGLQLSIDGRPASLESPQLSITEAQGYYMPQKKQFKGLPDPSYLVQDGMNFVLAMQPKQLNIPLGILQPGWHTVTFVSTQKSPWLILSHNLCAGKPTTK